MRSIPDELRDFDFCWSACSLEHLGSLDEGLRFIERSLATLAPGGIAVHTTEYNLTSNDATPDHGHTVLYRRRDLEQMVERLEAAGHEVAALDLDRGAGVFDEYVDLPPYGNDPHLAVWYKNYTTTSIALVVRAKAEGLVYDEVSQSMATYE
jgi:SAM-dependent methyltransferase